MKTIHLLLSIFLFPCLFATEQEDQLNLYFESDQFQLTQSHREMIDSFLSKLDLQGDYEFIVTGHTDAEGSQVYNYELSRRRAESIGVFFEDSGLHESNFSLFYRGEMEPLIKDSFSHEEDNSARNRRVEIVYSKYHFETIEDVLDQLKKGDLSVFHFDQSFQQILKGKKGSIFQIPANSFVNANGEFVRKVRLEVKEALDYADFIEDGLETRSGSAQLVSGGMLKIQAFTSKGEALELQENKRIQIAVPARTAQAGMSLFTSKGGKDWQDTEEGVKTTLSRFHSKPRPVCPCTSLKNAPQFYWKKWKKPRYQVDEDSKPRKPSEPIHPKKPKRPNPKAYTVHPKWYQLKSKSKQRAQAAKRYLQAKQRYDAEMDAFLKAYPAFQIECDAYTEKLNKYIRDLAVWQRNEAERKRTFEKRIVPENYSSWRLNQEGERQKYDERFAIWSKENSDSLAICTNYYNRALQAWKQEDDSLRNIYFDQLEALGIAPSEADQNYLIRNARLGWINIDRFQKFVGQRSDLVVKRKNRTRQERFIVLFEDIKSCMQMQLEGDYAILRSFPIGEEASIFAYKIENGSIYLAEHEIVDVKAINLSYRPVRFKEFRELLNNLGKVG